MIELNEHWDFKDVQDNIKAIKKQYEGILSLFSWKNSRDKVVKIKELKHQIFNYENIQYWQRERTWETINGDFDLEEFKRLGQQT